jgi:TonB family protein
MTVLFATIVKVSLVAAVGLIATALLRRRSAAVRHWLLAATVFCALAMPVLERILPAWPMPVSARSSTVTVGSTAVTWAPVPAEFLPVASAGQTPQGPATPSRSSVLPLIWLAGTALSLAFLVIGLVRLAWLASRATPITDGPWASIASTVAREYGVSRAVRVLKSDHAALLVTWGLMSPKVLIPHSALSWSDEQIRIVLRHELAHISRGDWIAQLAGEIVRAAYWFNPLVWFACARLRVESELACDDEVLTRGVPARDYAAHLLEVARTLRRVPAPRLPVPAMARPSRLERRFDAMLNNRVIRTPATRAFRVWTAATCFAATALVAAAGQSGPSTLSGSVFDPSGKPVPGVTVILTNKATNARFEVKTDDRGEFRFVPLPADTYVAQAELPGFKKAETDVRLTSGNTRHVFNLALGTLTETIHIVGDRDAASRGARTEAPARGRVSEADLPRTAYQRALETCEPSTVGGRIRPPRKIKDVRPVYPADREAAGIGGTVVLSATIGTDGLVKDVQVVKGVDPAIDAAAVEAVRQWQFDGTLLNCSPSEVTMNVSLTFSVK